MKLTTASLVTACVLAQQAAATYNWGGAKSFSSPANTNNECTEDQKSGFDWSDLPTGGFNAYKDFEFSGFDCSNSDGKRSLSTRTGSPGKVIQGKVNKNAQGAPKISCSTGKAFSITDMEVSTSRDTDIDFVYDMPDGSSCRQTESCSKDGSSVKNSQCGGALSVSFQIPEHGEDKDCDVGIHSVGFDCQPASTPTPTAETSSTTETSSSAVETSSEVALTSSSAITSIESSTSTGTTPPSSTSIGSSSALSIESSLTIVAPTVSSNLSITDSSTVESPTPPPPTPIDTSVPMTTSTVYSTFTSTTLACSSDVPDCPASSLKIVTMTTAVSTTICPVSSEASSTPETSPPSPDTSSPAPETSLPVPETSTPAPGTSVPASETSAPAPETSQPATETQTAPAESTDTSVLPGSTPAPSSPPAQGSSFPTPESFTAVTSDTSGSTPATSEMVTTEIIYTTTTLCPVTVTSTSGSSTITTTSMTLSETVVTSTVTVCTKCTEAPPTTLTPAPATSTPAPPATSPESPTTVTESTSAVVPTSVLPGSVSSAAPVPSDAPCPEVLPSCLNTWLSLAPNCASNSDASCYCPSKAFTDAVIGCVQAWGASADEMSAALSYFTGICAASVPENPAIITAVPSTITLCPTASVPPAPVATAMTATAPGLTVTQSNAITSLVTSIKSAPTETAQIPVTIISYTQTVTPAAGGSASVMTSAVTVPQVSFITNTVTATPLTGGSTGVSPQGTTSVGLVPVPITTPIPTASRASNGTTPASATSSIVQFTGAAVRFDANGVGAGVAAFAGLLAFLV